MLSVIKTAIITIIISFISGVLLDYYKNYAPRIVSKIIRIKSRTYDSKDIKVYNLVVKNISNKTLHNLNINLQGDSDNLKMDYTRITKGLKYDVLHQGKEYDISIPFLSKDDEFKAKVFVPIDNKNLKKPLITLRSPENFKEINSYKDSGALGDMLNGLFNHKKAIISIVSILIIAYIGILGGEYYAKTVNAKINSDNAGKPAVTVKPSGTQQNAEIKSKTIQKKSSIENKTGQINNTKNVSAGQNQSSNNGSSNKAVNNKEVKGDTKGNKAGESSGSTDGSSTNKSGKTAKEPAASDKNTANDKSNESAPSDTSENTGKETNPVEKAAK